MTRLLTVSAPGEVYSHFLTARCLVICREVQHLCNAIQAVHSTPASFSIAEAHQAFLEDIQSDRDCLERIQTSIPIDGLEISMGITSQLEESLRQCNLLQLRGQATFQPGPESVEAFSTALAAVDASPEEISALVAERKQIRVEASVQNYIVQVARATRKHPEIELGASPRATLALFQASQSWAAIKGRSFVLPDDVKAMAPHVLTHRLMISPQLSLLLDSFNLRSHSNLAERFGFSLAPPHGTGLALFFPILGSHCHA